MQITGIAREEAESWRRAVLDDWTQLDCTADFGFYCYTVDGWLLHCHRRHLNYRGDMLQGRQSPRFLLSRHSLTTYSDNILPSTYAKPRKWIHLPTSKRSRENGESRMSCLDSVSTTSISNYPHASLASPEQIHLEGNVVGCGIAVTAMGRATAASTDSAGSGSAVSDPCVCAGRYGCPIKKPKYSISGECASHGVNFLLRNGNRLSDLLHLAIFMSPAHSFPYSLLDFSCFHSCSRGKDIRSFALALSYAILFTHFFPFS